MDLPHWLVAGTLVGEVFLGMVRNGVPKSFPNHSPWENLFDATLFAGLLYWAGFWSNAPR